MPRLTGSSVGQSATLSPAPTACYHAPLTPCCACCAAAADIFDVFTNDARVKAFTQSDATVSREVGGEFKMFGGSIEGVQRELQPGKLIVQDWRFTTWPDGLYSKARSNTPPHLPAPHARYLCDLVFRPCHTVASAVWVVLLMKRGRLVRVLLGLSGLDGSGMPWRLV